MSDIKRYAVFGFYGGWNSGDEALFESVRSLLLAQEPDAEIVVICTRLRESYADQYRKLGVRVVPAKSFGIIKELLRTHQLIIGGGQIITGDKSYKGLAFQYWLTRTARRRNQPACMIGIGVEGVHRRIAKWLCRRIVANASSVACRDEYSLNMLRNAGCQPTKLRLSADVVLSKALTKFDRVNSRNGNAIAIGLHHSPLRQYASEDYYLQLVSRLRRELPEYQVVLVSNDARERFDAGLLDRLASRIDDPMVMSQHFTSLDEVIDVYATAACVVSVRMHPLILGLIHDRPVVGIPRSNKVKNLASRIGFPLGDPDGSGADDFIAQVKHAIDFSGHDMRDIENLARSNFDWETPSS